MPPKKVLLEVEEAVEASPNASTAAVIALSEEAGHRLRGVSSLRDLLPECREAPPVRLSESLLLAAIDRRAVAALDLNPYVEHVWLHRPVNASSLAEVAAVHEHIQSIVRELSAGIDGSAGSAGAISGPRGITLFPGTRLVRVMNRTLHLPDLHYELLRLLLERRPEAVSYEDIWEEVWGEGEPQRNLIQVHVSALRERLRQLDAPGVIANVRGYGYRMP